MNTYPHGLHDRLWQGAPCSDEMTALLDRPAEATRAAVYAAARAALPPPPAAPYARLWHALFGREGLSFSAWAACATLVLVLCVHMGPADRGAGSRIVTDADVIALADVIEHISHATLLTGETTVDIDDIVFVDELQAVSQSLASLGDDLNRGYDR